MVTFGNLWIPKSGYSQNFVKNALQNRNFETINFII